LTEIVRETVTTQENNTNPVKINPVEVKATNTQSLGYVIYFVFGILEVLLAFRLVFKLAGASTSSAFVRFIYGITGIFILPFEGIFRRGVAQGVETASILEPSTIVALIVYILLAWGIVKLIGVLSGNRQETD
jgi:hypothetical protein